MNNFESLLQEIRSLAKSVTKEEFKRDLKEYNEIYNKSNSNVIIPFSKDEGYEINSKYFSVNTFNVFTDSTYVKVG